jgi:hypothetical protein
MLSKLVQIKYKLCSLVEEREMKGRFGSDIITPLMKGAE